MKLYLLASSALALLSTSVYSQESTTAIVLKGSSLRGASKFLVKKVDEYALKGGGGPPGGGGGGGGGGEKGHGGGPGGDDGPGGGDKKHDDGPGGHGHGGPPPGPDDGPPDGPHHHNKHGGPPKGPDDDDQPGPGHHGGPPGGDDDCPQGMVGCDPATWSPGNKKPPKPPNPHHKHHHDDDDDEPPKPKHHHDDDDDKQDDDDLDNTREASDIPNEIKKLGKGYCDADNNLVHLNKCVELYGKYCKTDLLMEENADICKYLGYGGDDVVMAME